MCFHNSKSYNNLLFLRKSSLLKSLSGYDAFIKDQLFATLDTTTKKIKLKDILTVAMHQQNIRHKQTNEPKRSIKQIKNNHIIGHQSNLVILFHLDINQNQLEKFVYKQY